MDRLIILIVFALFVFASPFTDWWLTEDKPWYLPYVLWAMVIALAGWVLGRRGGGHDI